jgi:hypothetical protein
LAVVVVVEAVVRPMAVAEVVAVMSLHFKHLCLAPKHSLGSLVLEDWEERLVRLEVLAVHRIL